MMPYTGLGAALVGDDIECGLLLSMDYASATERVATFPWDVDWDGDTYEGLGRLESLSPLRRSTDSALESFSLVFGTVDPTRLNDIIVQSRNRDFDMYFAIIDPVTRAVMGTPIYLKHGAMQPGTQTGSAGKYLGRIDVLGPFAAARRVAIRTYSHGDQQTYVDGTDEAFIDVDLVTTGDFSRSKLVKRLGHVAS